MFREFPRQVVSRIRRTLIDSDQSAFDEIRARGFMQHKHKYMPPDNVNKLVDEFAGKFGLNSEKNGGKFESLDLKARVLIGLGTELHHFIPSSKLHYIQSIDDVKEFYARPVDNITEYAKLARDEAVPENLAVRENPVRFHPNDKEAVHGGVTAFPGEGGKVLGLRNKRIYRPFQPKQEWFDYEDQTFDHEPVDKNMSWDVEIAKKMDSYVDRKFKKDGFHKIR